MLVPRPVRARRLLAIALMLGLVHVAVAVPLQSDPAEALPTGSVGAGRVLRVSVPEAIGAKTVLGQLTVDRATGPGFVTAYGCADGLPHDQGGGIARSDVNFDGRITPVASNRLIVQADADGELCFYTSARVDLIIDLNAVSFDVGINSFPNRRTDTRRGDGRVRTSTTPLRVVVPEAVGGRVVVGQLTVDRTSAIGFVTAYGCADGLPRNGDGGISRSDLNYDGRITPVASNRLVVQADRFGAICLQTSTPADLIVDVNAVSDVGIGSFPNRRTDTRRADGRVRIAGSPLRVVVPEAAGGGTVVGQLTVDRTDTVGFVTAYGCTDGLPRDSGGGITRSDLNYDGGITPAASNRLVVQADQSGAVCFHSSTPADLIVDINATSSIGITSFPNRRVDTRGGSVVTEPPGLALVPQWPPYTPLPPLDGVAALTGAPASAAVARRPILAVKIDNFRLARPQWGLDRADAVFELNVEGITRFMALFHSQLPDRVGPIRSARTADLDLLAAMNRPVFAYSGANEGVTAWLASAAQSGVIVDRARQPGGCYARDPERPGPHDLWADPGCVTADRGGPARPLWDIDAGWNPPVGVTAERRGSFTVAMDGLRVEWTWDPTTRTYLRSQAGEPHLAASGARISANTVVVIASPHLPSVVDARSPHPGSVGMGDAVIHRGGTAIEVTWVRPTVFDPFTFVHPTTGVPVPLDQGRTFVMLARDR